MGVFLLGQFVRPAEPAAFASEIARYIVRRYSGYNDRAVLSHLLGCTAEELAEDSAALSKPTQWLSNGEAQQKDMVLPFLTKVDEFDLNEFIRSIHFDELKVPTVPFQLPNSKNYYGLAQMRQGEVDFFKAAVLSRSKEPLILNDDTPGTRRAILSVPPQYTLSGELLERILDRNGQSGEVREKIVAYAARQRNRMERILGRDPVTDELPIMTETEFSEHPMALPLSGLFHETDVLYTYEEYLEHLEQTKAYAAARPNYTAKFSGAHTFRNIQIAIHEGNWAVISKNKAPAIHFVIRHPKLLSAIENFIPPIVE